MKLLANAFCCFAVETVRFVNLMSLIADYMTLSADGFEVSMVVDG
jgi:hypothetical protein